jgi:hypothetical protein
VKKFRIPSKLKRAKTAKPTEETEAVPGRVTSDTVSKHRDAVLGKARKFKYPFAHSKHRIAITSVIVVILAIVLLGTFTGLRLYRWQDTNDFTYRTTQLLPFPIAKVDGSYVSYESYLFELRSSVHWQEKYGTTDLRSPDGKRQIDYLKRSALEKALTNSVAHNLAKRNNVKVEEKEIDEVVARIKASGGNLEQILGESFNFTEGELRRYISDNILRRKVAKQLDKEAPQKAQQILGQIRGGKAFADAAKESSDDAETKQLGGDIGVVEKGRANVPEEVAEKIFQMKTGEVSDVISTASDYFIVQAIEKVDENRVRLAIIRVKVKDMAQYLQEYREQSKVSEYIKLPSVSAQSL